MIRINGTIGPGLARRLASALDDHAIETIDLQSPGGLIDEALAAARVIERRGDLIVYTHGQCNSACVPILLAGRWRLADAQMVLGFHAPFVLPGLPADATSTRVFARPYYDFLLNHGVSRTIVARTQAAGSASYYPVKAVDLVESGVLANVTYEGHPVLLPIGKWLAMESALWATNDVVQRLMAAIRVSAPATVMGSADQLYAVMSAGDRSGTTRILRTQIKLLRDAAFVSAIPETVKPLMIATAQQMEVLRAAREWHICARFVRQASDIDSADLTPDLIKAGLNDLTVMILSAGHADWVVQLLPPGTETVARALVAEARDQLLAEGIRIDATDDESVCITRTRLARRVLTLDTPTAIAVQRWLDHNPWP